MLVKFKRRTFYFLEVDLNLLSYAVALAKQNQSWTLVQIMNGKQLLLKRLNAWKKSINTMWGILQQYFFHEDLSINDFRIVLF